MGVDHAQHLDDSFDLTEIAKHLLQNSQLIDRGKSGTLIPFRNRHILSQLAGDLATVRAPWSFAREKDQIPCPDAIDIVGDRVGRRR